MPVGLSNFPTQEIFTNPHYTQTLLQAAPYWLEPNASGDLMNADFKLIGNDSRLAVIIPKHFYY